MADFEDIVAEVPLSDGSIAEVPLRVAKGYTPTQQELQTLVSSALNPAKPVVQAETETERPVISKNGFMLDALTGLIRGAALQTSGAVDLGIMGAEYLTGNKYPKMSPMMENDLNNIQASLGVPQQDSTVQNVLSYVPIVANPKRIGEVAIGALTGGVNEIAKRVAPENEMVQTAATLLTPVAATGLIKGTRALSKVLSPTKLAEDNFNAIYKDIKEVAPEAFQKVPIDKAQETIKNAIKKQQQNTQEVLGEGYEDLFSTREVVATSDLSKNLKTILKNERYPLAQDEELSGLIGRLGKTKKLVNTDGKPLLDEFGKPIVEDIKYQLSEIGKVRSELAKIKTTDENKGRIIGLIKDQLDTDIGTLFSEEEAETFGALNKAWYKMRKQFGNTTGVGKILNSDRLETVKTKLLGDVKSTKKIAKILTGEEKAIAAHLMFTDVFKKAPIRWAKTLQDKRSNYAAMLGEEKTNKLIELFSQNGTVGEKLLKDNKGLGALLSVESAKKLGAVAIGSTIATTSPILGILAASGVAAVTAAKRASQGKSTELLKSMIIDAATGGYGQEGNNIAKILSKPYNYKTHTQDMELLNKALINAVKRQAGETQSNENAKTED